MLHRKLAQFSKNQKLTLASSGLGYALENMDVVFLALSLSLIMTQMHVSNAAGGLMITLTNIAKLVGAVVFGILSDTFSRVKIFTYTLALIAIATAAMYFAPNIDFIYVCRLLTGLGAGGEYGVGVTLVAENFKGHKLGSLLSNTMSMGMIGVIFAALIASAMLPTFGWRPLFLIGLLPIALAFFVRLHLKENKHFVKHVVVKEQHTKHHRHQIANISKLFATPKITWQTIALIIMTCGFASGFAFFSWFPAIMKRSLHLSTSVSSLLFIVINMGVFFGMIAFGKLLDRFGPRKSFTIFLLCAAVVVYTLLLPINHIVFLAAIDFIIGFFVGSTQAGFGIVISKLYPMDIRVTANGFIMDCGYAIGGGIAPVLFGILMDKFSLVAVLMCITFMALLSLIIMHTIPNLKKIHA